MPILDRLTLDFYARLNRSEELIITLPGAARVGKNIYPLFARIRTFLPTPYAFMAFADPTMQVDRAREMLLAWFLGGPGWDPAPLILRAIRKAQGKTGAKHVAFVGGSGGGFAALRLSAMIPGSMAFIQEPQTDLARYIPRVVDLYFRKVWPGWDGKQVLAAFPDRFNMVQHYANYDPKNFVYYAQSIGDTSHVQRHYLPFKAVNGVKDARGINARGTRHFALYKGEVEGHGRITPEEFECHAEQAFEGWRDFRARYGFE